MTFHSLLLLLSFCFILCLAWLWHLDWAHHGLPHLAAKTAHPMVHRLLKPRTPLDCPTCRLASTVSSGGGLTPAPVRPWREVKSRREAPKRVNTEGYAYPDQQCAYCGITDAHIHALIGDGKHGQAERIQTFRGPACHPTFTARRHSPLYRLKAPSPHIGMVLTALAEGLDPSAAERVFGYRQATITSLSHLCRKAGVELARPLLLPSPPPTPAVGRTAHKAPQPEAGALALAGHRSPLETSSCPACGNLHATVAAYGHSLLAAYPGTWLRPLFTSDGLNLYFYALTAHFGHWLQAARRGRKILRWQGAEGLISGQGKKSSQQRKLVRVTHVMRRGTGTALKIARPRDGLHWATEHGFS